VPGEHVVVHDVREAKGVAQHNYLVHHAGKLWVMWSDGPGVEDRVGQRREVVPGPRLQQRTGRRGAVLVGAP
jgi:hypothetical protein